MANVAEVYPNFSAVGDLRLEGGQSANSHFSVVGTLPQSARNSEPLMMSREGSFPQVTAAEAIILSDFGRELLDLPREPRGTEIKLTSDQAEPASGPDAVLQYHKRETGESAPLAGKTTKKGERDPDDVDSGDDKDAQDMQSFNLVPKQLRLKIVGIVSSEPNRGLRQGRTPIFLPLGLAEVLDMVQAGELWSTLRPSETKTYIALIVRVAKSKAVSQVEDDIRKQGFSTFSILDASKGITRFFTFLDLFLGIFGAWLWQWRHLAL